MSEIWGLSEKILEEKIRLYEGHSQQAFDLKKSEGGCKNVIKIRKINFTKKWTEREHEREDKEQLYMLT